MRKQLLIGTLIMAAAVLPAAAQGRYGPPPNRGGYGSGGYGNNGSYGYYGRQPMRRDPVQAAMRDLNSIFRRARVDHHEANHFRRALDELNDFQRNAARGRFDRGSLNSALNNMGDLAKADQLHPRDRQIIRARMDDLYAMRNYGRY